MNASITFVVSDLHLGSEHFYREEFLSWLDGLPPGACLVLNGDIVDDPRRPLPAAHREVLARLARESHGRPLIWVRGNHDEEYQVEDPGQIEFVDRWEMGRFLLVVHGDDLDDVMPRHELFKWLFKRFHRLRLALGFRKVHVAEYAKKWGFLYRVLNDHVARNALSAAKRLGFQAIACGHTHAAMDREEDGVRYLNSGAWTEKPLYYLAVDGEGIALRVYADRREGEC